VHRHAFAARDVADDLLAANRIAAARAVDQHIVDASHGDPVAPESDRALHHRGHAGGAGLLQLLGRHELGEHLSGADFAVSDGRQQFAALLRAPFGRCLVEAISFEDSLEIDIEAPRLLLE